MVPPRSLEVVLAERNMTGAVTGAVTIAPTMPSGPSGAQPPMRLAASTRSVVLVTVFSSSLRRATLRLVLHPGQAL